jgi:hypothetical protein
MLFGRNRISFIDCAARLSSLSYPIECNISTFETVPSGRTDNKKTPVLNGPDSGPVIVGNTGHWTTRRLNSDPEMVLPSGVVAANRDSNCDARTEELDSRESNPSVTETAIPLPSGPIFISTSAGWPCFRSANFRAFPFLAILVLVGDNEKITPFVHLERECPRRRVHRLNLSVKDKDFVAGTRRCIRDFAKRQTENANEQDNGKPYY